MILSLPFFWRQYQVLQTWPETEAQVIRSEVVTQPAPPHEQLYAAKLQVLYTVDGRPITAELISFQSQNYQQTADRAAQFPCRQPPSYPLRSACAHTSANRRRLESALFSGAAGDAGNGRDLWRNCSRLADIGKVPSIAKNARWQLRFRVGGHCDEPVLDSGTA